MSTVAVGALGQRKWTQAFLKAAVAGKYKTSTMALAMALSELHFNRKTGQCNPGYPALATELGCTERTINRAANDLEDKGWVKRHKPGQHDNVEFTLTFPASPEVTTAVTSGTCPEVTQNGSRGDNCCHPFNEEHLNTKKRVRQFRPRPGVQMLAQIEAESREANEKRRRRKGSSLH